MAVVPNSPIWLTGDPEADRLLTEDDNALLIGMILDQQVPMEKAFTGPLVIAQRMGGTLDVAQIAAMSEEAFVALCSERPAIHRFPGSMAKRVHQACRVLAEQYGGQATQVWKDQASGADLKKALAKLPGFGPDKAAIFTAVLGKRRGITPPGWRRRPDTTARPTAIAPWPTSWTRTRCSGSARPRSRSRRPTRRPRADLSRFKRSGHTAGPRCRFLNRRARATPRRAGSPPR
jgi:uncharacterized HhH-GPD family protein